MMSIHLICHRDQKNKLIGLKHIGNFVYTSESWLLDVDTAQDLVEGWIYLHATKSSPSEMGGKILEVALTNAQNGEPRYTIKFAASRDAVDRAWRGHDHQRAWTGGLVPADLEHESLGI